MRAGIVVLTLSAFVAIRGLAVVDTASQIREWESQTGLLPRNPNERVVEPPKGMKLILLMGQSNMAGRADVPEEDREPLPRAYKLNRDDQWVAATAPFHFDRKTAGMSPANEFVKCYLADHPDETVGIVPCAVGGSRLATWFASGDGAVGANFRRTLSRMKAAAPYGDFIVALWHQGETDAGLPGMTEATLMEYYPARFSEMVDVLRKKTGQPELPVVVGEIGRFMTNECAIVNPVLNRLGDTVRACRCVSSDGLKNRDKWHFDGPSAAELGRRYYQAYKILSKVSPDGLDLVGKWQLSGKGADGAEVRCPIAVPGDVQTALRAAGKMVNPFFGQNELKTQWVGRRDWTISRTFEVGADLLAKKAIVLRMEDVDTFATIRVNGHVVGRCDNRFCRWEFDLKPYLKPGRNEISGFFESPERKGYELVKLYGDHVFPMCCVQWAKNQSLVRKPACHGGWDWGLAQQVVGFCGTVKVLAYDDFKVDYIASTQRFNGDLTHCDLTVCTEATDADGRVFVITNRFAIDNPPLWWPNGAGEQKFYDCMLDVRGRKIHKRIGLRKLEVLSHTDRLADGREGYRLAFKVNNRELFMKGANWIPCNAFADATTPARVCDLLDSAAAANMNMIRVWGGGQYETDDFYDLCDKRGLLVWQDFMFACAAYPCEGPFLDSIRREFRHQVKRLRDHTALALWCGDNECIGAPTAWPETEREADYHRTALQARHEAARQAVTDYDPSRHFWLSSPSPGGGKYAAEPNLWDTDALGDMHNWQVWHENKGFDQYYKTRPRFCSEFGYQSFSSREVAETYCRPDELNPTAPDFEYHQKNDGGNQRILETMARYFRFPQGTDAILYLSQVQQAVAIKTAVEWYRSLRPHCMGAIYWQLNDNWPVASWSSIEYGGKWKHLHYHARRFYAPLAVAALPKGRIVAFNDQDENVAAEVVAEYWSFDGRLLKTDRWNAVLAPDAVTDVGTWAKTDNAFVALTLKTPRGTFANDWFFDRYKSYDLPMARVTQTLKHSSNQTMSVELSTDAPAFFVWLDAKGVRGEFSDNSFTLLPGRPKTVRFVAKDASVTAADFQRLLTVTHLAETYKPRIVKDSKSDADEKVAARRLPGEDGTVPALPPLPFPDRMSAYL